MKNHSKSLTCAAVSALVLCLAPMAGAQSNTGSSSSGSMDQSSSATSNSSYGSSRSNYGTDQTSSSRVTSTRDARKQHSAQKLMGRAVNGSTGEKLGDINDFVIDSQNGRICYVVVSSGGVLGIGDTLHLVPASALTPGVATTTASAGSMSASMSNDNFSVNVDKNKWKDAPKFQKDQLASLNDRRSEIDQFYGQASDSSNTSWKSSKAKNDSAMNGNGQLVLASDVIGKDIRSGSDKVGNIDDLVINWANRLAAILLDPDHSFVKTDRSDMGSGSTKQDMDAGRSGVSVNSSRRMTGNGKYVISFSKVDISGTGHDAVTTSLTRDQFTAATTGSAVSAGTMNSAGIYAWQGWDADPGLNVSVDTGSASATWDNHNANVKVNGINNPNSSMASNDQATVDSVRRVLNDGSLPDAARQVQVSQKNGKLVLTGTVPSEDLKNTIEDKVEKAANGWDVDNQISVAEKD